jgi:hypothetical protein
VEPESSPAASSSLLALSLLQVHNSANEILGQRSAAAAAGLEMRVSVIDLQGSEELEQVAGFRFLVLQEEVEMVLEMDVVDGLRCMAMGVVFDGLDCGAGLLES